MNLDSILKDVKSVGISGHVRPDGDCVGSTLGLYGYIRKYYPEIDCKLYLEKVPECFYFLSGAKEIVHVPDDRVFDCYFALDCGDLSRLGDFANMFSNAKKTACIDHHKSNSGFADEELVVPGKSSTSELIFELLPKERITKEIAEALYVGIVHDTGVFQYSCTTAATMNAAGFLMECGIDYSGIVDYTYYEKTINQNKILAYAINISKLVLSGAVIESVITKADMERFEVTPADLDGIINQLRITKGVEVAVFLYESGDNEYKVSLRSKRKVDLSEIALKFGGGGHERAAGATMKGTPEEIFAKLEEEIKIRL